MLRRYARVVFIMKAYAISIFSLISIFLVETTD